MNPSYLRPFDQTAGPNYRPNLVHGSQTGPSQRGYSFSTRGVPTGPNFAPTTSIYDGFDNWAETKVGDETTAWMKASMRPEAAQQVAINRAAADAFGDKRAYAMTPYAAAMNQQFKPRNAWGGGVPSSGFEDEVFPRCEAGKYMQRPEVPEVYQKTFPAFFDSERVPPMFNPYLGDEALVLARHYQGHPTMPIPPQMFGGDAELTRIEAIQASDPDATPDEMERLLFGDGVGWWKWSCSCATAFAKPREVSMREHEEGHAIFRGNLTADLPNGNSTVGHLNGWTCTKSAETLLDLRGFHGLEITVRGDGKTYNMVLGSGYPGFSSVEYVATIPPKATAHKWRLVRIAWDAFKPQLKNGRPAPDAPGMDGLVGSVGFAIGDRQWGPFLLEVGYVMALKVGRPGDYEEGPKKGMGKGKK